MGRHGRGKRRERQQRHDMRRVSPASPIVLSATDPAIPFAIPSAEAIVDGRVVMLSQAATRGVTSYATTAAALQAQQARTGSQFTQPGAMTSPDRQYPAMPQIARKSPLLESMGAPGTAIFQGIITNDDYNPDFFWRDAIEIYDQMIRNDGQIMAIVQQLELPIRRATWTIEPYSDSERDKEIASFIESCLFHDLVRTTADGRRVYQKWDDILRHALMMLRYGFAAFEKVWRKEDGWVKLAHLMPLLPMSVYRWWVGQDNELVGIQQYTFKNYTYRFVDIPADKVLLFTHRMEGQNYQGFSLLRAAYKHWYYKDQFYKIDAIGLERNAIAVPYIELPTSFNSTDVSQAQSILANLRANESMGVTLPPGWKIGYIPGSEHYAGHAMESIKHHDVMIARAVLAQFINLGSNETGTYNLAVDQRQDLLESLQAESEYIEDTFNSDLIPQLVDFNFAQVEGYPRIKCSKLAQADITELTDAISKLKARDANFLTPDPELEDWVRDMFGMPKASKSVIAAANPTAPETPGRPDAQPGQATSHETQESASVAGKKAPSSPDNGDGTADGGGSGDGGAQANEMTSATKQLAEALSRIAGMDAVDRGLASTEASKRLESMKLFNPNHDPHSGQFASGGAGGGGGSRAEMEAAARGSAHHGDRNAALQAIHTGMVHEAGGGGSAFGSAKASSGRGSKAPRETIHEKSARLQSEGGLKAEARLGHDEMTNGRADPLKVRLDVMNRREGGEINPQAPLDAHLLAHVYGEHQLGKALQGYSKDKLEESAHTLGLKPGASKAETISRITSHVTEGRYSADFGKSGEAAPKSGGRGRSSAKAEKPAAEDIHEKSARLQRAGGLKSEAKAGEELEVQHFQSWRHIDVENREGIAETIVKHYGEHQLGNALSRRSTGELKDEAERLGVTPGRTKAETVSRITSHVTEGRYSADFGKSGEAAPKSGGRGRSSAKAERAVEEKPAGLAAERQQAHEAKAAEHYQAAQQAFAKRDAEYAKGRGEESDRQHAAGQQHMAAQREELDKAQHEATIARSQDMHGNQLPEARPGSHPEQIVNTQTREEQAYLKSQFPELYHDEFGATRGTVQALGIRAPNPNLIAHLYGEHQTGAVLHQFSQGVLRKAAEEQGLSSKGAKAALVSRLTTHATGGRYTANFSASKGMTPEAHAAKAATLKAALDKAQAAYDAHMARAPQLSESVDVEGQRLLAEVQRLERELHELEALGE